MAIEDFDWVQIEADLKRTARKLLTRHPGPKPSATSLVQDTWVELARSGKWDTVSQKHLVGLGVQIMRKDMYDAARQFYSQKRGGGLAYEELDPDRLIDGQDSPETQLLVNEALEKLRQVDERAASVFEYRRFGGCLHKEIAELFGISESTVRDDLQWAAAYLKKILWEIKPS